MRVQATAPTKATADRPRLSSGFGTLGEFLRAVAKQERSQDCANDPRLEATISAAYSGLGEAIPSTGGFLVQSDLAQTLLQRLYQTGEIAGRCQRIPLSSPGANGLKLTGADEDSRADGSRWGGVQAYWVKEGDAATPSKPKLRQVELLLQKLIAVCYATAELVEDAGALDLLMSRGFGEEMLFKLEDAIINGSGVGEPLGILNSAAALEVTKDGGDTGAVVTVPDVLAMWKGLWSRSRRDAVWLVNPDLEETLYPLTLGAPTATILLYTPPGQSGNEYGRLLGAPVIPVEHCATLGTPGDIILADLSQYVLIDKGEPAKNFSIHVNFLEDEDVFRFTYRVDGQPAWKKPVTPKNGTNQQAPFTFLSARS
jgi:HK97 family phage major capsid protein